MHALLSFTKIGRSINLGCFEMTLKSLSSSSRLNDKFSSLNSFSPFRIKSFGLRLSFFDNFQGVIQL